MESLFDLVAPSTMTYDEWTRIGHARGWLGVRHGDGATSRQGVRAVSIRGGSQRATLLAVYARHGDGLTDEEAGNLSGLATRPRCCYWKRCSELRQAGFIVATSETRLSTAGEAQTVCRVTEAGRRVLGAL